MLQIDSASFQRGESSADFGEKEEQKKKKEERIGHPQHVSNADTIILVLTRLCIFL